MIIQFYKFEELEVNKKKKKKKKKKISFKTRLLICEMGRLNICLTYCPTKTFHIVFP